MKKNLIPTTKGKTKHGEQVPYKKQRDKVVEPLPVSLSGSEVAEVFTGVKMPQREIAAFVEFQESYSIEKSARKAGVSPGKVVEWINSKRWQELSEKWLNAYQESFAQAIVSRDEKLLILYDGILSENINPKLAGVAEKLIKMRLQMGKGAMSPYIQNKHEKTDSGKGDTHIHFGKDTLDKMDASDVMRVALGKEIEDVIDADFEEI